jgi:antitoxin MazE
MKYRVQKWGNSLAVRIPKLFARDLGLAINTPVLMGLEEGTLVVRPDKEQIWDLDALLAKVTAENLHSEWETEAPDDGPGENDR